MSDQKTKTVVILDGGIVAESFDVPLAASTAEIRNVAASTKAAKALAASSHVGLYVEVVDEAPPCRPSRIFASALGSEMKNRDALAALAEEDAAEHRVLVGAFHEEFRANWPDLAEVALVGDYGRPYHMGDWQTGNSVSKKSALDAICVPHGLHVSLCHRISPEELELIVTPRRRDLRATSQHPSVRVQVTRHYPYETTEVFEFHHTTPVGEAMEKFFELLAKRVYRGAEEPIRGRR